MECKSKPVGLLKRNILNTFAQNLRVMSTVLYDSPIFGPVHSRRLGVSLGINLMPADGKICTFDCIYCECGRNASHRTHMHRPTREEVATALKEKLEQMKADAIEPNVLTFAGNGEPTAHPDFPGIMADTIAIRDEYFPKAKVSVLSNGTRIMNDEVFDALKKIDNNIQKLDTVDPSYIEAIDVPVVPYDVSKIIDRLAQFNGHVIIQTMFMKGNLGERDMNNTGDSFVLPWIEALKCIKPEKVMIYTIDRETPVTTLQKATHEELDRIVALLEANGFSAQASY